jgi:hypothetical protein
VLRAQGRTPPLERQRLAVATLDLDSDLRDERDQAIRADILATADPAMVLNALVRGLAHLRTGNADGSKRPPTGSGLRALLVETTLERLLQAVALDPSLVSEIRLLLGPLHGEPLLRLCDDLEEVAQRVRMQIVP